MVKIELELGEIEVLIEATSFLEEHYRQDLKALKEFTERKGMTPDRQLQELMDFWYKKVEYLETIKEVGKDIFSEKTGRKYLT